MRIQSFADDLLDLSAFGERLKQFIDTEHAFVEGGLVVALNSPFGSGKSTFLRMWREALNEQFAVKERMFVVELNAWESDYLGDPLFSILSRLIASIPAKKKEKKKQLLSAVTDTGWLLAGVGAQIGEHFTGVNMVDAAALAESKKEAREQSSKPVMDAFTHFENRQRAMECLRKAIEQVVVDENDSQRPTILFLVDELDRCRPDYAISYLETIKHIFDIRGAVFVLAIDRQQLENAAKTAFGQDLNFNEYFRKFVHRIVPLPTAADTSVSRVVSDYVKEFIQGSGRKSLLRFDDHSRERFENLMKGLRMTLRQAQEVFRVLGHVCATAEEDTRLDWCWAAASMLLSALHVCRPDLYDSFGRSNLEADSAIQFLKRVDEDAWFWWFMIVYTGGGVRESDERLVGQMSCILERFPDEKGFRNELARYALGWSHSEGGVKRIAEKIDQVHQWT